MKLCTCYSHQFVKCQGQAGIGAGWKCANDFDRELQAIRDAEERDFQQRMKATRATADSPAAPGTLGVGPAAADGAGRERDKTGGGESWSLIRIY